MKAKLRRDAILRRVSQEGEVAVDDLADDLAVAPVTIRRDLAALARDGLVERTHGGAALSRRGAIEFGFHERRSLHEAAKAAIGRRIASMIRPGTRLSLDTGTTTLAVANAVAAVENLTVLTSSLAVASALYPRENIDLILLGGSVRKGGSPDLMGWITQENLRRFRVDLAVIGADAVAEDGPYTNLMEVASISRAMIEGADCTALAVDTSKFAASAFVHIAEWERIDVLVTDASAALPAWIGDIGCRVEVAEPETQ